LSSLGGGVIRRNFKIVPGLTLVELPVGLTVKDALKTFNKTDSIVHAQPNYLINGVSTLPYDTRFDELWGMHNIGQTGGTSDADIDATQAWDTITDSNIVVAVIDSGIDYTHPDLWDNLWINQAELNGTDGIDDDNNGYIDDICGYDFYNDDSLPYDHHSHGTHCSGIIGAVGNNNEGVTGTCWNVKIMTLRFLNKWGEGSLSDAILCIQYAVDNGAKVLNNSWSIPYSADLETAIEAADANGVLFVASAGNDGDNTDSSPHYPSGYDCNNIISVMATDDNDERSIWSYPDSSNYGLTTVDLAAPGTDILSTFPTEKTDYMEIYDLSTCYETRSGTSMATPHVAGACALVWAANPQLTHLEVKDYILQGVDKLDSLDDLCVTEGRLNLRRAVKGKTTSPYLVFTSDDNDVNCVEPLISEIEHTMPPGTGTPYNWLYYNITFDANGFSDTNAAVVDYLHDEVDEPNWISDSGIYDGNEHTVTWQLGSVGTNDSNTLTIQCGVNEMAEPGGTITNTAVMEGDNYLTEHVIDTSVCPWGGEIIYVDKDANGFNIGTSWDNAYKDLQDGFTAAQSCGAAKTAIWVAAGTYKPIWDANNMTQNETFDLIENVSLFGHFEGWETNHNQRNFADANNETILDGQIGSGSSEAVKYIPEFSCHELSDITK